MNSGHAIVLAVAAFAIVAIMWGISRKRRNLKLRERIEPEHDHGGESGIGVRQEEYVLRFHPKRRGQKLDLQPLSGAGRATFLYRWSETQGRFVDNPKIALTQAENLIGEVLQARGCPKRDFDEQLLHGSRRSATVTRNYQAAHDIVLRYERGRASTEDLRQAMLYYRAMFLELLRESQIRKQSA
jgi:hypothetical protein